MSSPHRKKNQEAKDFAQDGRVPTLSIDHCFLGSEEEAAAANPVLVAYDGYSGAMFAVAVASKECEDWLADYIKAILDELGYGGCRVAIKCDNARELLSYGMPLPCVDPHPLFPYQYQLKNPRGMVPWRRRCARGRASSEPLRTTQSSSLEKNLARGIRC